MSEIPQIQSQAHESTQDEATLALAVDSNEVLGALPIIPIGQKDPLNPDRSLGFPHVLYHGTKDENFTLDDTRNHRNSNVRVGARAGKGLYAASKEVSQGFGSSSVIELIPSSANLLDLSSEQAREPLSNEFKEEFLAYYDNHSVDQMAQEYPDFDRSLIEGLMADFQLSEGLITKQQMVDIATKLSSASTSFEDSRKNSRLVKEVASWVNTARMMHEFDGISVLDMFAAHDSVNGKSPINELVSFDISPFIDFLTSQGVDGAVTAQKFGTKGAEESGVVFWKLDNVGDAETWKRRRVTAPKIVGSRALSGAEVELAKDAEPSTIWVAKEGGGWERKTKTELVAKPKLGPWEQVTGGGWQRRRVAEDSAKPKLGPWEKSEEGGWKRSVIQEGS